MEELDPTALKSAAGSRRQKRDRLRRGPGAREHEQRKSVRGQTRHAGVLTNGLVASTHYIWGLVREQALPLVSRHKIDLLPAWAQKGVVPARPAPRRRIGRRGALRLHDARKAHSRWALTCIVAPRIAYILCPSSATQYPRGCRTDLQRCALRHKTGMRGKAVVGPAESRNQLGPVEPCSGVGLATGRNVLMTCDVHPRSRCSDRMQQFDQRRVLGGFESQPLEPFQFDTDREVVAVLPPAPHRCTRMPCPFTA